MTTPIPTRFTDAEVALIDELVERSGLVVDWIERAYAPAPRPMRPWVYGYLGRARRV